ncbi:MAG: ABC-type uncharacterized transport system ATPase subunit [Paraglaciecola sp.]|jgi:ABC-type uncharacterized transport system ATPase subunit
MGSKTLLCLALLGSLLLSIHSVSAEQVANPLDFLNSQLAEQLKNQMRALSDPELIKAQAAYHREFYLALIDQGFSKEDALKIIVAMAGSDNKSSR